ncbi:MAG: hypothetical protein GY826_33695, partial [Fuerstiella sp.]|nr:hypothetical protein [Fuerstiella sp.]
MRIQRTRALLALYRTTKDEYYHQRWKLSAADRDRSLRRERQRWLKDTLPSDRITTTCDWRALDRILNRGTANNITPEIRHPTTGNLIFDDHQKAAIFNDYYNNVTDDEDWVQANNTFFRSTKVCLSSVIPDTVTDNTLPMQDYLKQKNKHRFIGRRHQSQMISMHDLFTDLTDYHWKRKWSRIGRQQHCRELNRLNKQITNNEITYTINSFKNNVAAGPDRLHVKFL